MTRYGLVLIVCIYASPNLLWASNVSKTKTKSPSVTNSSAIYVLLITEEEI